MKKLLCFCFVGFIFIGCGSKEVKSSYVPHNNQISNANQELKGL